MKFPVEKFLIVNMVDGHGWNRNECVMFLPVLKETYKQFLITPLLSKIKFNLIFLITLLEFYDFPHKFLPEDIK